MWHIPEDCDDYQCPFCGHRVSDKQKKVLGGLIIGFIYGWKMALVVLGWFLKSEFTRPHIRPVSQ